MKLVFLHILSCLLFTTVAFSADQSQKIKVAFTYQFTKYITWPSDLKTSTFNIYVSGDDVFAELLGKSLHGREVKGLPVKVSGDMGLAKDGHMYIFKNKLSKEQLSLVETCKCISIGFYKEQKQEDIVLYQSGNSFAFDINHTAIKKRGLYISARLLNLANKVK